jgi:peptidoglycan hydrolase FlgJ
VSTPLAPPSIPGAAAATAPASTTYTDLNGLAALKANPSSPETIRAVSEQVEALFLQMMLKSMRDAASADGELDSNETGMYQDMFDKQVALTLAKRQDLGIARLFERQLGGKSAPTAPALAPAAAAPASGSTSETDANGRQKTSASSDLPRQAEQFVAQVLPTIRRAAASLGVNPVGMLAQAALETGWGQRMPRTADGASSLNLFGVKAGEEWAGARAVADTVEFSRDGVASQRRTSFRAYGSIEESVSDFAKLLAASPRYRDVVAAGGDAQAYVDSIARSGYATDPEYGDKLNRMLNGGVLRAALNARVAKL